MYLHLQQTNGWPFCFVAHLPLANIKIAITDDLYQLYIWTTGERLLICSWTGISLAGGQLNCLLGCEFDTCLIGLRMSSASKGTFVPRN